MTENMNTQPLAPCPKCHYRRVKTEMFEDYYNMGGARIDAPDGPIWVDWCNEIWVTYCYSKKCDGSTCTEPHATRQEAIADWNAGRITMAEPPEPRDWPSVARNMRETITALQAECDTASHNARHYSSLTCELEAERATLLARVAELEAEAAARWEPVAQSLEYDLITHAIKHGEIPQGYRICRKVSGDAQPAQTTQEDSHE